MAEAAIRLNQLGANAYFTLNPVLEELSARSRNHPVDWPKHTTADDQIMSRRWLLVNVGAIRWYFCNHEEQTVTLDRAGQIRRWLMEERNWPAPVTMDSGNRAYPLFRLSLGNNQADRAL